MIKQNNIFDNIKSPIVTEKSTNLSETGTAIARSSPASGCATASVVSVSNISSDR